MAAARALRCGRRTCVRPLVAAMVFSTKPTRSACRCGSRPACRSSPRPGSGVDRRGVVPQSSCSFRPITPASTCWRSAAGWRCPCPGKPRFIGKRRPPAACARCSQPRRAGGGEGAGGRARCRRRAWWSRRWPAPPRSAAGRWKWMCASMPPAVTIMPFAGDDLGAGPMTMSTPGCTSGLPALPMAAMRQPLQADVGLDDAPVVDDHRVGDHAVHRARRPGPLTRWLWPMPSRMVLPPPNFLPRRSRRRRGCRSFSTSITSRCRPGGCGRPRWGRTSRRRRVPYTARTRRVHQFHGALLARLESAPRAGGDVQAHAPRRRGRSCSAPLVSAKW